VRGRRVVAPGLETAQSRTPAVEFEPRLVGPRRLRVCADQGPERGIARARAVHLVQHDGLQVGALGIVALIQESESFFEATGGEVVVQIPALER